MKDEDSPHDLYIQLPLYSSSTSVYNAALVKLDAHTTDYSPSDSPFYQGQPLPQPVPLPQPQQPSNPSSSSSKDTSTAPTRDQSRDTSREPAARYTTYSRSQPNKKHKPSVQACDACAVRKVKCENQRPCTHCVVNRITCTTLRERKKSGPKNLHRRTLDCISYLNEVIEVNYNMSAKALPQAAEAAASSTSTAPAPATTAAEDKNSTRSLLQTSDSEVRPDTTTASPEPHDYKPTPYNMIENISLIAEEPVVHALLKPLTVQSLIRDHAKLINFLTLKFSANNGLHSEINLLTNHDDSIFLSTLLIVLTINMIIAEILIKLKKQKYKDFVSYPKKSLLFRNFKNFKNLCHFKCMEINTLIEKNFIVPPIIPQNNPKNINNINLNHINQYQIYYNLSLSCLHLCNYYHTLNLTNTLNSNSNLDNNYGNEAQEHHKLINLRKSITYYQLINIKTSDNTVIVQLHELYEILFCYERFYLIYSSNNYNINMFRNNDVIIQLSSKQMLQNKLDNNIDSSFESNILFDLIHILHQESEVDPNLLSKLSKQTNFNINPEYSPNSQLGTFLNVKQRILDLENTDPIFDIIKGILIFKLAIVSRMTFEESNDELFWLISYFTLHLANKDCDLVKVQMSNFQLLQPLLHLLRIALVENGIDGEPNPGAVNDPKFSLLIDYTDNLIKHFPFFNNINKLIRATKVFSTWFVNLDENRLKAEVFKKQTQTIHKLLSTESGINAPNIRVNSTGSSQVVTNQPSPDNDNDDNEFFAIVPKIQHGPRINNYSDRTGSKGSFSRSLSSAESDESSGASSVVSNSLEAEPHIHNQGLDVNSHMVFGSTPHDQNHIAHIGLNTVQPVPVPVMDAHGTMGEPYQESVPVELMPHAHPEQPHDKEYNSNSMSESTMNLYNLFNQISDDFTGDTSHLSMTNLFQFHGAGFTPHGTPRNPPN
ncbi:uncharacterized protein CANTADRAFT_19174 [Suhomyces tanzawaensis NRRL Y-17324]|uniref:Zn(2)-C6 fungal-type domain-containing protein n=1 Tax=Suhomyces tanzawaensis NRRL Y-17324 TaxID=984487 RepID=A0A1E4SQ57_9ASCO|nr:uncharacterized protein CANTADRAFT_19174 [Suhomyces tanzawaensis NRRL Y-17324]ODV81542.1 hypothetical protein CANTADRAFT_19174 [Suhomyces tanzawaensis NRRL Y-17324]